MMIQNRRATSTNPSTKNQTVAAYQRTMPKHRVIRQHCAMSPHRNANLATELRSRFTRTPLSILVSALLFTEGLCVLPSAQVLAGEVINYPASPPTLMTDEWGNANSLAPAPSSPSGNAVEATSGTINYVYGGATKYSSSGENISTDRNTLTIDNVNITNDAFGAKAETDAGVASASNNTINAGNAANIGRSVFGGYAITAAGAAQANYNTASVGTVDIPVVLVGGFATAVTSGSAEASNNTLTKSGSLIGGDVYAGRAITNTGDVTANNNEVTMNGGTITGELFGGYASTTAAFISTGTATASSNKVTLTGGSVTKEISGGGAISAYIGDAYANRNEVTLDNVSAGHHVYGGEAFVDTGNSNTIVEANENTVKIGSGSQIDRSALGGSAITSVGTARSDLNHIVVDDTTVGEKVAGGYASASAGSATTNYNVVKVSGNSRLVSIVFGGYAATNANGSASATHNSIIFTDSSALHVVGASASAQSSLPSTLGTAVVTDNTVKLGGNSNVQSVYGGDASVMFGTAEAERNIVEIDITGTIGAAVYGGSAIATDANGISKANANKVTVNSGTILDDIYGGYATADGQANADNNTITIRGGDIQKNIYGGYANSISVAANSTGNTVTLSGAPTFSAANTSIYGEIGRAHV